MVSLMTPVVPLFVPGSRPERFARIDGEMVDVRSDL